MADGRYGRGETAALSLNTPRHVHAIRSRQYKQDAWPFRGKDKVRGDPSSLSQVAR